MTDKEKADINIKEIEFNYTPLERAARQWVTVEMSWDAYDGDWFKSGVDTFLAGAEWAEKQPKWIKCSERLPELMTKVLAIGPDVALFLGWLDRENDEEGAGFWSQQNGDEDDSFGFFDITHWYPLPEAPKEEE